MGSVSVQVASASSLRAKRSNPGERRAWCPLDRRVAPLLAMTMRGDLAASLRLRRPVHIVAERECEKLRRIARRVDDRPRSLAKEVLIFACSADPLDRAGLRTFVGHENLVAVAVRLNACTAEGVALAPGLRFLDAADREVIQSL